MRRSIYEIVAEMLQAAKKGAKKTRIMYQCNLSYRMNEKILRRLLELELLRAEDSYYSTEKGLQFLQAYQTIQILLNTKTGSAVSFYGS